MNNDWNWKMRCTKSNGNFELTVGKVYSVRCGTFEYDNGRPSVIYNSFNNFHLKNEGSWGRDFEFELVTSEPKEETNEKKVPLDIKFTQYNNILIMDILHMDEKLRNNEAWHKKELGRFNGVDFFSVSRLAISVYNQLYLLGKNIELDFISASYDYNNKEKCAEYKKKFELAVQLFNEHYSYITTEPTEDDLKKIEAIKLLYPDIKYLCKNKDGDVRGFKGIPEKKEKHWVEKTGFRNFIEIDLSFLSWYDDEPYSIYQEDTNE